jgi:uncharacterized protein
MDTLNTYTAFEGDKLFFHGPLAEVVLRIKKRLGKNHHSEMMIFCDSTGSRVDFNFHGSEKDVLKRLSVFVPDDTAAKDNPGPGRPRLGVASREISLFPRHWEWLATQPGGASATLRRLVEEAKKRHITRDSSKHAQERTHKFLSVVAGDRKGYEEALRFLYRKEKKEFLHQIIDWPPDIRAYATQLAKPVFASE